jgi:hypothetical protein
VHDDASPPKARALVFDRYFASNKVWVLGGHAETGALPVKFASRQPTSARVFAAAAPAPRWLRFGVRASTDRTLFWPIPALFARRMPELALAFNRGEDNRMTGLAQFFLVLTSLAPMALVQAAVEFGSGARAAGYAYLAGALLLLAIYRGLWWGVRKWNTPVRMEVSAPSFKESEPLGFLVAYALPLVGRPHAGSLPGLCVFAVLMGLVVWQQQLFYVNPLLALLGFHFFSAKNDRGAQILIIARTKVLSSGLLSVIVLSDYLWLDSGEILAEHHGSTANDSARRDASASEA